MDIHMSFAMEKNPRNRAIFDHEVKPEAIEFTCTRIGPSELFWRQLRFAEFDVSEMSLSSLLIALANGDDRYMGLPIFTTRRFFQTSILVHRESGINAPEDLKGRKMGVPEFQQTAAVWVRGILKDDFGVDQTEIEWFMERLPEHSHGGATGFTAPPGTIVNFIPSDKNIGSMVLNREIDGTLLWFGVRDSQDIIDRTAIDLPNHADVKYLFDPPRSEGRRFYAKHQFMPINHAMVIRRSLAEKYPWAPMNIYKAMVASNEIANRERIAHVAYHLDSGLLPPEAEGILNMPIVHHGLKANGKTIELAAKYSNEQGLTPRRLDLAEIFHPSTLDE